MIWERRQLSAPWLLLLLLGVPFVLVIVGIMHLRAGSTGYEPPPFDWMLTLSATILAAAYFPFTLPPLHPIGAGAYRKFLQSVAWTPGDPLLRGPPYPVWADLWTGLALVSAAAILGSPLHAAIAWIALWLSFALTAGCLMLGCRVWSGFGLSAVALLAGFAPVVESSLIEQGGLNSLILAVAATGPLIVWGRRGIQKSLATFPWDYDPTETIQTWAAKIGSPFDRLVPIETRSPIGYRSGALIGAAAAAIALGLFLIPSEDPNEAVLLFAGAILLICAAVPFLRWISYAACHRRPFAFRKTRAIRGRVLLPEYDQIFVAPLAALGITILVVAGLRLADVPWFITAPAALWANLTVVIGCPPQERVWALTGAHNIPLRGRPPSTSPQQQVRVRSTR